jgi:hypothetical protein
MKPVYEQRCAQNCQDARRAYRLGTQWIHVWGRTQWVCGGCANKLGRGAGLPTRAEITMAIARRERGLQLRLDRAPETHSQRPAQA